MNSDARRQLVDLVLAGLDDNPTGDNTQSFEELAVLLTAAMRQRDQAIAACENCSAIATESRVESTLQVPRSLPPAVYEVVPPDVRTTSPVIAVVTCGTCGTRYSYERTIDGLIIPQETESLTRLTMRRALNDQDADALRALVDAYAVDLAADEEVAAGPPGNWQFSEDGQDLSLDADQTHLKVGKKKVELAAIRRVEGWVSPSWAEHGCRLVLNDGSVANVITVKNKAAKKKKYGYNDVLFDTAWTGAMAKQLAEWLDVDSAGAELYREKELK